VQFAVLMAVLAGLGWALTQPAGASTRRLAAVAPFLCIGLLGWTHRPYLFAYLCLAAVLLVAEGRLDRRWLLLVGWVWLNTHGSWPLGLAAVAVLWVGRRLDRELAPAEAAAGRWLVGGLLLGCLNPYGPRLLAFPLVALERREAFAQITEWRPPAFDRPAHFAFLVAIVVALLALRLRPSYRLLVPLAVFTVAALLSARNVDIAVLVLVPLVARAMAGTGPAWPPLLARATPVLAAGIAIVAAVAVSRGPGYDEGRYPVDALERLTARGLGPNEARWVAQDFVGNWLELRGVDPERVFIDDRYELVPASVVEDYRLLVNGRPGWDEALASYRPDVVVWQSEKGLAALLDASPCWRIVHRDAGFVAALPAGDDSSACPP